MCRYPVVVLSARGADVPLADVEVVEAVAHGAAVHVPFAAVDGMVSAAGQYLSEIRDVGVHVAAVEGDAVLGAV